MDFVFFLLGIVIFGAILSAIGFGVAEGKVGPKTVENSKQFNKIHAKVSFSLIAIAAVFWFLDYTIILWCSGIGLLLMAIGMCISKGR